jgi:hypothetical protein
MMSLRNNLLGYVKSIYIIQIYIGTSFKDDILKIQLYFLYPLNISANRILDYSNV